MDSPGDPAAGQARGYDVVAEEGPDLVEHFFPQRREPLPGGGRGQRSASAMSFLDHGGHS